VQTGSGKSGSPPDGLPNSGLYPAVMVVWTPPGSIFAVNPWYSRITIETIDSPLLEVTVIVFAPGLIPLLYQARQLIALFDPLITAPSGVYVPLPLLSVTVSPVIPFDSSSPIFVSPAFWFWL